MVHLPHLIQDLGLILIAAAIVTLICRQLKQPVVLGYLIAGMIVGPNFDFLPTVQDTKNISIWAEIGVIFMLFGLGLEFSFKKLAVVGKSASITAIIEIVFMLAIGYFVGQALGWSNMDSLFLGGILSISSTTIIVRAFEELGLKGQSFVQLVFGALIVEDLIAILLLVLLTSVAATQTLSGPELISSSFRLGFFMVLWFVLGIYLLPTLLKKFKSNLSDETTLIVSIGLCLLMVIIAHKVGFSPALGAFIMGSLFAETREGHRIERLILPVKDLFSAVFFVSVGMLIDFEILSKYFWVILLITGVTVVGKLVSTTVGALLSGRSLKTSTHAGMSLAQIGEFSFIIATLGMALKVTSDFLYPIAVAVSALTTFTTPYLIKFAPHFYKFLDARLPDSFKAALSRYESAMSTNSSNNVFSLVWSAYGIKILLNSVLIVSMTLAVKRFVYPILADVSWMSYPHLWACGIALVGSSPFLWAVFLGSARRDGYDADGVERLRRLQIGILITRFFMGCALVGFVVGTFTSLLALSGFLLFGLGALGIFFSRMAEPLYKKMENRFVANLTDKDRAQIAKKPKGPELAPWNATLAEFTLSPNSELVAKTLVESGIKEKFGVTIAMIERGEQRILAPQRNVLLLPYDKLFLIGTDDQLELARRVIESKLKTVPAVMADSFGLTSITLDPDDFFVNKPIRDSGLREAVNGLIVGVERAGERILSPDSSLVLQVDDLIWIVGDRALIRDLRNREGHPTPAPA